MVSKQLKARPQRQRHPHILPGGDMGLTCTKCRRDLPLDAFNKHTRAACGYQSCCKDCQRQRMKKQNYGIEAAEYERLRINQAHRCRTCGKHESEDLDKHLVVDHCHKTGAIRGLLCHACNTALGLVKDSAETLGAMIAYLKSQNGEPTW